MSKKDQKALVKELNEYITPIQTQIDEEKYDESLIERIKELIEYATRETKNREERRSVYVKNLFIRRGRNDRQTIKLDSLLAKLARGKNFMRAIALQIRKKKEENDDDRPPPKERESKQEQKEREEKEEREQKEREEIEQKEKEREKIEQKEKKRTQRPRIASRAAPTERRMVISQRGRDLDDLSLNRLSAQAPFYTVSPMMNAIGLPSSSNPRPPFSGGPPSRLPALPPPQSPPRQPPFRPPLLRGPMDIVDERLRLLNAPEGIMDVFRRAGNEIAQDAINRDIFQSIKNVIAFLTSAGLYAYFETDLFKEKKHHQHQPHQMQH